MPRTEAAADASNWPEIGEPSPVMMPPRYMSGVLAVGRQLQARQQLSDPLRPSVLLGHVPAIVRPHTNTYHPVLKTPDRVTGFVWVPFEVTYGLGNEGAPSVTLTPKNPDNPGALIGEPIKDPEDSRYRRPTVDDSELAPGVYASTSPENIAARVEGYDALSVEFVPDLTAPGEVYAQVLGQKDELRERVRFHIGSRVTAHYLGIINGAVTAHLLK
jgi:hypothetical protein